MKTSKKKSQKMLILIFNLRLRQIVRLLPLNCTFFLTLQHCVNCKCMFSNYKKALYMLVPIQRKSFHGRHGPTKRIKDAFIKYISKGHFSELSLILWKSLIKMFWIWIRHMPFFRPKKMFFSVASFEQSTFLKNF